MQANDDFTSNPAGAQDTNSQEQFKIGQRVKITCENVFNARSGTIIRVYPNRRRYSERLGYEYVVKVDDWHFSLDNEIGFNADELKAAE